MIDLSRLCSIVDCFTTFFNAIHSDDGSTQPFIKVTQLLKGSGIEEIKEVVKEVLKEARPHVTTTNTNSPHHNTTNATTNNIHLHISINHEHLKHFDVHTYQQFIDERLSEEVGCKTLTLAILHAFEEFIRTNSISPKGHIKGGSMSSYGYSYSFKTEFVNVIEDAFNIKQKKLKGYPNEDNLKSPKGFEGVRLTSVQHS